MSEKLDGWFARWDGARFTTASGATICTPDWFTAGLPTTELRGELWGGRGGFEDVGGIAAGHQARPTASASASPW